MRRRGFTVLELLIVLTVIATLAGGGYAGFAAWQAKGRKDATRSVIAALEMAIAAYPQSGWTTAEVRPGDAPRLRQWRLWDANGDGVLDGRPAATAAEGDAGEAGHPFPAELRASGYPGALGLVHPVLPKRHLGADGRVLDAWKRPLRVRASAGSDRIELVSDGPDGLPDTADDLRSTR